jgi:hypothetical protein
VLQMKGVEKNSARAAVHMIGITCKSYNKATSLSRCAPWTALPLLVLCMASPFSHKTINNKSAAVCGVR